MPKYSSVCPDPALPKYSSVISRRIGITEHRKYYQTINRHNFLQNSITDLCTSAHVLAKLTIVVLFYKFVHTYEYATMTKRQLNNSLILHVHKYITYNEWEPTEVAKELVMVNDER